MENLILENNSYISDINLYNGSSIRDTKLGIRSYIAGIGLNDYADFRQVELGISSYIEYINADVSACFKRTKLGIDSYISYFGIGVNGYFKHVEMGDQSSMYCNGIGDYSYFQYVNLGINSQIYLINQTAGNSNFEYINVGVDSTINSIALGPYCSFDHITIGSDTTIQNIDTSVATYASVRDIDIKNNSYFGGLDMASGSYVRNIDIATDCEVGSWDLSVDSNISSIQLGVGSGFGGMTVLPGVAVSTFEIGTGFGIGGITFTSSVSEITLSREFSNLYNTATQSLDASVGSSNNPLIDFSKRSIITIDITGAVDPYAYELGDGNYEGQELTFVIKSDGTHTIDSTQINIWTNKLVLSGNGYGLDTVSSGYYAFRPFARWNGTTWDWRNVTKAIWTGGVWVTDAEAFND
jgi:hypothetical protein